jgi:hypothetical protein
MNRDDISRRDRIIVEQEGSHEHRERIVEDIGAERRQNVSRVAQFVWLLFGILEALISLRIVFKLIAANSGNAFVIFVYSITEPFLWPFFGITGTPAAEGHVLEITSLIAMFVYALFGWIVVRMIWVLFYRPSSRRIITYDQEDR